MAKPDCPECELCCAAGICCPMGSEAQRVALAALIEKGGLDAAAARKAADIASDALSGAIAKMGHA